MNAKTKPPNIAPRDTELDEELVGILAAISVVSKRLAKKLLTLQKQLEVAEEGGVPNGNDE